MASLNPVDDRTAELAAVVRAAWAEGLGHQDFGDDENFFTVGGHSMCAVRIVRTLKNDINPTLTVRRFFQHPTVTELAAVLASTVPAAPETARTEAGA